MLVTPTTSTHTNIDALVIDIIDKTGTFELGQVELDGSVTSIRINCDARQVTIEGEFLKKCDNPRHRHEPMTDIVNSPRQYNTTPN
mmetsp:Transcript_99958/g.161136  ORF Transcript_99958/g.161136 Transcript_99958/m.161136 type:complete len:86 (-) Transcript_99958:367-624(-)